MSIWSEKEDIMEHRHSLLEEICTNGMRSPVTQKIVFDLCLCLLPLVLISLV
ncbi:MAG: hypothetical protein V3U86_12425 [Acidobacteriota bacterium]